MTTQELSTHEVRTGRGLPIEGFRTQGLGALDFLLLLVRQKRLIICMTLAGAIIAGAYSFRLKDTYTATAVIALPPQQRSTIANLVGQFSSVGNAIGGGTELLKNPSELYIALLSSRTVADAIIPEFNLQQIYRTRSLTGTRKALAGHTRFTSGKDFLIRISVSAGDPKLAAGIANAYVDRLHQMNSRLVLTESGQRRRFFEERVQAQKQTLTEAEMAMKATQERTGLVQLNSQMDAAVRTVAQLRAEVTAREVRLETLRAGATENHPDVVRLRVELDSLREQMRKAESGSSDGSGAVRLGPANAPTAGLAYLRSLREFQYQEALFQTLSKQYETAKLDEAKEAPLVQVVDAAIPPEQRDPKRRVWMVFFGACCLGLSGACLAVFWYLLTMPDNREKLVAIRRALWSGPVGVATK
jgi:tyrosine-protein kinase Etk/Wzc